MSVLIIIKNKIKNADFSDFRTIWSSKSEIQAGDGLEGSGSHLQFGAFKILHSHSILEKLRFPAGTPDQRSYQVKSVVLV